MFRTRQKDPMLLYNVRVIFLLANMAYQLLPLWLMYTSGQAWPIFITIGFFFGFVPLFDWLYGDCRSALGSRVNEKFFVAMLCLQAAFHFLAFLAAIALATSGRVPLWGAVLAVTTIGMLNVQCPVIAHEFGHKLGRANRMASNLVCAIVGMGYFMPQHVRGHHIQVATPEDCASAKFGQDALSFIVRSFPAEVRGGFTLEAERLRKRGLPVLSPHNDVLVSYAISIGIAAVLVAVLGWQSLPWIVLHHLAAWFTLMLNDYIQHYGLMRELLPNGRREPAGPMHSWNTDTPMCNLLVFNVQRHSHHHEKPMLPYQNLRDMADTPRLPTGYFGMMIVAMIPPLWFRVMDPRVIAAAGGRRERVNVGPSGERRLERLLARYAPA
jgi:alkane 1-monooxygenase